MSDLFISSSAEGEFAFTTLGFVALAALTFAVFVIVASHGNREKRFDAKKLAFCAVCMALAFVTSYIKLFDMPMGGAVTLASMFFITFVGYLYGPAVGLTVGVAYGILQLVIDPYMLSLPQVLVDYFFAFGALGLSGFLAEKKNGLYLGYILAVFGRFFFSTLSGVIFFAMYAPEEMNPVVYSAMYNGGYLGAEAVLTLLIPAVPAVKKALAQVKTMARS